MIYPEKLNLAHALYLSTRIRKADLDDLKLHGAGAEYTLAAALVIPGEAWAVMHEGVPVGCGGWTEEGLVWTLWTELSSEASKEMMRMVVPYARILAIRAKRPLGNWFASGNRATERFLRATHCVDIADQPTYLAGKAWTRFSLKSLEDLPNV